MSARCDTSEGPSPWITSRQIYHTYAKNVLALNTQITPFNSTEMHVNYDSDEKRHNDNKIQLVWEFNKTVTVLSVESSELSRM